MNDLVRMTNESVIDKLEALRAFYSNLKPELAREYVGALDAAIAAINGQPVNLGPDQPDDCGEKVATAGHGPDRDFNPSIFAERLFIVSQKRDLTLREIGRRAGITGSCMSRYKTGVHDLMLGNAVKIARVLDVPLDFLLGLNDGPQPFGNSEQLDADEEGQK